MKPFLCGALAGYVLALLAPRKLTAPGWKGAGTGNLLGNAGGFAGGNPGNPQGPGFYR